MQAPIVSSIVFDQPSYEVGQLITATVAYVAGESDATVIFSGVATDSATGQTGTLNVSFVVANDVADATLLVVSDSGSRVWSKISDSGSVAVFTAIA